MLANHKYPFVLRQLVFITLSLHRNLKTYSIWTDIIEIEFM